MDGIDLLKAQALSKRNSAILAARREYNNAIKEIVTLQRKLGIKRPGRPRKTSGESPTLKATTVAREILLEGQPMTLVELTIEVRRRGCRPLDDPRIVAKAIHNGLQYYRSELRKDENGRWCLLAD